MVKEVIVYPDKRLKERSKEVEEFDSNLHQLLDDMYDTMIDKKGVGLAAIQIAVPKRVLIINIPIEEEDGAQPKENTLEVINPEFLEMRGESRYEEGCLSVPGFYEEVKRYKYVKLKYYDRYGKEHIIEDDGFLAIALQHEYDHLEGKLFIEKLPITKRKRFEKEWKKKIKK
ncbi:MAG: peptide deformylase [Epsilonproteobacteria bacterium]|nr:peptide deformylase [Campylobacterota bacterium]